MLTKEIVFDTLDRYFSFFEEQVEYELKYYRKGFIADLHDDNRCMYICVGRSTPKGFLSVYDGRLNAERHELVDPDDWNTSAVNIEYGSLRHIPLDDSFDYLVADKVKAPHEDPEGALEFFPKILKYRYPKYDIVQIILYSDGVMVITNNPKGFLHFRENSLQEIPDSYEVIFQRAENSFDILGVLPYDTEIPEDRKTIH